MTVIAPVRIKTHMRPRAAHTGTRIAALLLLLTAPWTVAAADHHIFWEVKGAHNTVFLLGSVHMLKPADSALPPEVLRAYDRASTLVMELDLNDVDPEQLMGSGLESATLPDDQSLSEVVGPDLYAQFLARAKPLGLDPEVTLRLQPWFAAILLEQMTLTQSGFEAGAGIDMQFTRRAAADHKPIVGLETMSQQMGFFTQLSSDQQRQFLRATLKDLDTEARDTAAVVRAWQLGDTAELERLLRDQSAQSPQLFRTLTTDRNRRWLPQITSLLGDDHDALVIVGAMHLIGRDGIIDLLKHRGYNPVQH